MTSTNKINVNKPILLIDLGFALFYQFHATQIWYKASHPEEKDKLTKEYLWHTNQEYIEKYQKLFFSNIDKIAVKHSIPNSNIIIAEDCRRKNIWRNKIYPEYKSTRSESHRKSGFNGGEVFQHFIDVVIPNHIEKHGIKCFKHKEAEADDIIAIIALYMSEKYPNQKIIILSKDTDYFQLLDKNKNITMVNMKGNIITMSENPLMRKILGGDISDNIPACKFKYDLVNKLINKKPNKDVGNNTKYVKATKRILDYYTQYPEQLENDVKNYPDYIENNCYQLNQQLIDFRQIPNNIKNDVITIFLDNIEEGELPSKKISPKKIKKLIQPSITDVLDVPVLGDHS